MLDSTKLKDGYYDIRLKVYEKTEPVNFGSDYIYQIYVSNNLGIYDFGAVSDPFSTTTNIYFQTDAASINDTIAYVQQMPDGPVTTITAWAPFQGNLYYSVFSNSVTYTVQYNVQFTVNGYTNTGNTITDNARKQNLNFTMKCIPNGNNIVSVVDGFDNMDNSVTPPAIRGTVQVQGKAYNKAFAEDFNNYVLYCNPSGSANYITICANSRPVGNDTTDEGLSAFDTTTFEQ